MKTVIQKLKTFRNAVNPSTAVVTTLTDENPRKQIDVNIYNLYLPFHRHIVLAASALVACLAVFTDSIYLPALSSVVEDLNASDDLVALSVSVFLGACGVGQLFWGPISDHYGRTVVLYWCLVIFEGITIVCIFTRSIVVLILLRGCQGFTIGCTIISAQAIITDVFPPEELGGAFGTLIALLFLAPIIAPPIGGSVTQAFGWQGTFVLLAVITLPVLIMTILYVPETHHWFVAQRFEGRHIHRKTISERSSISVQDRENQVKVTPEEAVVSKEVNEVRSFEEEESIKKEEDEKESDDEENDDGEDNSDDQIDEEQDNHDEEAGKIRDPAVVEHQETFSFSPAVAGVARPTFRRGNIIDPGTSKNPLISIKKKLYDPIEAQKVYNLRKDKNTIVNILEKDKITRPEYLAPWTVLSLALDPNLTASYILQSMSFSIWYCCLAMTPLYLAKEPYSFSESVIGSTFLPIGVAVLIGSIVGGIISDHSSERYHFIAESRLLYLLYPSCFVVFGGLVFAYSLQNGLHLSIILISQVFLGFGKQIIISLGLSFNCASKTKNVGAVACVTEFFCFAGAAGFISISVILSSFMGLGNYFLILCILYCIGVVSCLWVLSQKFSWAEITLWSLVKERLFRKKKVNHIAPLPPKDLRRRVEG